MRDDCVLGGVIRAGELVHIYKGALADLSVSLMDTLPAYIINSILQDNAELAIEEYCDTLLKRDVRNTLFKSSVNSE